jgi:multiple sugar transport system permease protein
MLAPAIIMLVLFSIYPFIVNLINATSHYNFTEPNNRYFVGLENFVDLLKDKIFWQALYQTLYYVFGSVFLEFFLGFGVAYLLLDNFKGRDVFRTLYILPLGATPIAISLVWKIMLNPDLGIIPYFLKIIGFGKLDLLGNIKTVIPSLIIVDAWYWTPFMFLIFSAGLLAMPSEPFEAADIDGASPFKKLVYITFPLLKPLIIVAVLFRTIDAFRVFDTIFVLTGGGPGHFSETLNLFIMSKPLVTINLTFFIFSNGTNSRKPSITWGNAGFPLEEQVFYWFFLFSWL